MTTLRNIGDIIQEMRLLQDRQTALEERQKRQEQRMDRYQQGLHERNRRLKALLKLYPEGPAWELGTKLEVPARPRNLARRAKKKKEAT